MAAPMDPQTKELNVLMRHVPRIVISRFMQNPQHLEGPESIEFTAAVALFDLSGFSSLGSKLNEAEREKIMGEGSLKLDKRVSLPSIFATGDRISSDSISMCEDVEKVEPTNRMRERRRTASVTTPQTPGSTKNMNFLSLTKPSVAPQGTAVETLTTTLNKSLDPVIDVILKHGGDIIKFAGDALIVLWETEISQKRATSPGDLALRAIRCAIDAQRVLTAVSTAQESLATLGMHVGIGVSQVSGNHVGGVLNRWEFYLSGDANRQMSFAEQHAQRGQVMVSPEVMDAMEDVDQEVQAELLFEPSSSGNFSVEPHFEAEAWSPGRSLSKSLSYLPPAAATSLIPFLRCYVPGTIASYLQKGLTLTSCTLHITVVFARLDGVVEIKDQPAQLQQIHKYMSIIQESAYKVQGTLRQFVIDDKGAVAIIAIGLPPFYHEDNAFRGIKLGCYLLEKGIPASIGITTGNAFCGSVGSNARAEYAVVGDMINMAARLMTAAGVGMILCDEKTREHSESYVQYDGAMEIPVKGKAENIKVFSVRRDQIKTKLDAAYLKDTVHALPYGCDQIVEQVPLFGSRWLRHDKLDRSDNLHRVLVVSGDSGTGKTTLLRYFLHHNSRCFMGSGDPLESTMEFHAWRGIVRELVHMTIKPPAAATFGSGNAEDSLDDDMYSRLCLDETEMVAGSSLTRSNSRHDNLVNQSRRTTRVTEASTLEAFSEDTDSSIGRSTDESVCPAGTLPTSPQYYKGGVVGSGRTSVLKYLVLTRRISKAMLCVLNDLVPYAHSGSGDAFGLEKGEERSKMLEQVLFLIVEAVSSHKPILLIFDNAQLIDSLSWNLIRRVVDELPSVYVLVATRTGHHSFHHHSSYELIERHPLVKKMEIRSFSYQVTSLFLCQYYHIAIMDTQLLDFVYARTDGNPAALIKIMNAMIDAGYIHVESSTGNIVILHDLDDLDTQVPQHTRVRVMSCVDQLDDLAHMTLKIMSVNPDPVEQRLMNGILTNFLNSDRKDSGTGVGGMVLKAPRSESMLSPLVEVRMALLGCERNGIITIDDHNKVMFFNSTEMRLVVYDTMLPSQRQMLHGVYADYLRDVINTPHRRYSSQVKLSSLSASGTQELVGAVVVASGGDPHVYQQYAVLGYHLSRSGSEKAAIDAYHKAGEGAIEAKEFGFATDCLQSSYKLLDTAHRSSKLSDLDNILLRSRIEFMHGAVAVERSEWDLAITHLSYIIRLCQRKGSLLRRYSSSVHHEGLFESTRSTNFTTIAPTTAHLRDARLLDSQLGCLPFGSPGGSWFANLRAKGLILQFGIFNSSKRKQPQRRPVTPRPLGTARSAPMPRLSRFNSGRVQPEEALQILTQVNFYRKRAEMLIKKINHSKKKQEEMSREIQLLTLKSLQSKATR